MRETMRNGPAGCIDTFRICRVLVRYRVRIFLRKTAYRVRHTLTGKLSAAAIVIMAAILVSVAVGGPLGTLSASEAVVDALLLAAHLWLAVSLTLMVLCELTKAFIKQRETEPLLSCPALYAALARHRVFSSIPLASFTFTVLFFAYFWQLFDSRLSRLWLSIPTHLLTTGILVFPAALIAGCIGRGLLRGIVRRGLRNADVLVNATGAFSIIAFCALLVAIILANEYAANALATVGNSVAVTIPIGMIPFAAALAADEGRWLATLFWLGLSAVLALWAAQATYSWSFSAHREIPIDLATPLKRVFASVFTGRSGRWLPRGISAFWRKDIIVPYTRAPKRYLFHQVNVLWWGVVVAILAMALRNRGSISVAFADTMPVLISLFAMAVIAKQNGVNALGREGQELTWLRPLFTGPQLFGRKLLVNLAYTLVHGIAYAIVVAAASRAASLGTSFWIIAAYATGAGALYSSLATSIGFLLPDLERRRSSLPGSSAVAEGVYMTCALLLTSVAGVAHLLLTAGLLDPATYWGILAFVGTCVMVGCVLISAGAMRQYRGMEI
jgi:hypothetical protein